MATISEGIKLPPDTELVAVTNDGTGTVILRCAKPECRRDYAGLRECPLCLARRLQAEERPPRGAA